MTETKSSRKGPEPPEKAASSEKSPARTTSKERPLALFKTTISMSGSSPTPKPPKKPEGRACSKCGSVIAPILRHWSRNNFIYKRLAEEKGITDRSPIWGFKDPCDHCIETEKKRREEEDRRKYREFQVASLKRASGLGAKWVDADFEGFKTDLKGLHALRKVQYTNSDLPAMRSCKKIILEWAKEFRSHMKTGKSLILLGDVGTGKNHLSSAMINYVIENFLVRCLFTSVTQIFMEIKETFSKKNASERGAIEKFTEVGLLVVNELGLSPGTDYEFEKINFILNERIDNNRPFVLISNLNSKQLEEVVGDRLADRIAEHPVLNFGWPSFRPDGKR